VKFITTLATEKLWQTDDILALSSKLPHSITLLHTAVFYKACDIKIIPWVKDWKRKSPGILRASQNVGGQWFCCFIYIGFLLQARRGPGLFCLLQWNPDFSNHGTFSLALLQSNNVILPPIFWTLDFLKTPDISNQCLPRMEEIYKKFTLHFLDPQESTTQ